MMNEMRLKRWLMVLTVTGVLARVMIALYSVGSNDAKTWRHFGHSVLEYGLIRVYEMEPLMNHPPLMGLMSAGIAWICAQLGVVYFPVFKIPVVVADIACVWLLLRIVSERTGVLAGWKTAALYAWCPLAISVSGYHGNTDSIYAFFTLLAFAMVQGRRDFLRAGLALGAALNVKLIPLFLLPPLYALCRSRHEFTRLTAGLVICAVPYVLLMLEIPELFIERAIKYNSLQDRWGIVFLTELLSVPQPWLAVYVADGRYVILLAVLWWSARVGRSKAASAYHAGAMAMVLFLLLTPGFGVQYLVAVLPLLFAADVGLGAIYGLAAGALSTTLYVQFWRGAFPPFSLFWHPYAISAGWVGLMAYAVLLWAAWKFWTMRGALRTPIEK